MARVTALLPRFAVFLVVAAISASVAYVAVSAASVPAPAATAGERPEFELAGSTAPDAPDGPVSFDLIRTAGEPAVIVPLEPAELDAVTTATLDGGPPEWINPSGFPRIPPVTQFDGGPHQNANCTLAAGAMLARLGFGIVTTGSILRTLQDDQVGGTGLDDLQVALWRGYGAAAKAGALRPDQLKALLAAGYGAVIQGSYGEIPEALRLQRDYLGPHAVFLDGYFPGSESIPEAYYVVDPLGRPAYGYEGEWWPASVVDAFGTTFGGGRIRAAWVFPPGGVPPEVVGPDVAPLPPSGGDAPDGSAEPSAPAASDGVPGGEPGDVDPGVPPLPPPLDLVAADGFVVLPWLEVCLLSPLPPGCPGGIVGVFDVDVGAPAVDPGPEVEVAFVDSDRPNVVLIGLATGGPEPPAVRYWEADGTPATVGSAGAVTPVELDGRTVHVARLDTVAATTYHFQALAGGDGGIAVGPVGMFTTGPGVVVLDVALERVEAPVVALGEGMSPYVHLGAGLAPPPDPEACPVAEVRFDLEGIEAPGLLVRAFPAAAPGGGSLELLSRTLEKAVDAGDGSVEIGCLEPGTAYHIVLDAIGDAAGPLATRSVVAP